MTFKEFLGVVVMPICVAALLVFTALLFLSIAQTERIEVKLVEAEDEAWTSDYFLDVALTAALASAENRIAYMEEGSLMDCIDATCRVTAGDGGRGTGVVYKIDNDVVYVITNAHVATTPTMKLEFWIDGHKQDVITGKTTVRDVARDVAVIEVQAAKFKGLLPAVIPLASRDTVLEVGQEVWSAGCPRGEWTKAWSGHVLRFEGEKDRVVFLPPPFGGQSGSAIFNEGGTEIVALLNLQALNSRNESIYGLAVNIREIHDAIYGELSTEETRWGQRPAPSQCGPRGCPVPEVVPEDILPDVPFVLPVIPKVVVPEVAIPNVEDYPVPEGLDVPEHTRCAVPGCGRDCPPEPTASRDWNLYLTFWLVLVGVVFLAVLMSLIKPRR
jgi:hypothetical protein